MQNSWIIQKTLSSELDIKELSFFCQCGFNTTLVLPSKHPTPNYQCKKCGNKTFISYLQKELKYVKNMHFDIQKSQTEEAWSISSSLYFPSFDNMKAYRLNKTFN
jgi:hypothetical protein